MSLCFSALLRGCAAAPLSATEALLQDMGAGMDGMDGGMMGMGMWMLIWVVVGLLLIVLLVVVIVKLLRR
jgi:uncharacterized membrane protein